MAEGPWISLQAPCLGAGGYRGPCPALGNRQPSRLWSADREGHGAEMDRKMPEVGNVWPGRRGGKQQGGAT